MGVLIFSKKYLISGSNKLENKDKFVLKRQLKKKKGGRKLKKYWQNHHTYTTLLYTET